MTSKQRRAIAFAVKGTDPKIASALRSILEAKEGKGGKRK
jgi:hypothetical protein